MTELIVTRRPESRPLPAVLLAGGLAAGTAAAWLILSRRMAGMDAGPGGDPGAPGWFAVTWLVMTAAMMLPVVAPAVLRLARAWCSKALIAAAAFVLGYGAVWMVAGLVGYVLVRAARGLHPDVLGWSSAGRFVAAGAVAAAGLYQLTGVKHRWLERCTSPRLPRPGEHVAAALIAGARHGGCCVACCWPLMVALYALGMMSLSWMAVVTVLIAGERLLPRRAVVLVVRAVLVVLGIAVAGSPAPLLG